jgi:hypothetical protein
MENRIQSGTSRRVFLGAAAAALFAGVSITLLGCGDDSGTGPTAEAGDIIGEISGNHGHKAIIKKAQFDAGGAVTLDIQGSAGHNHTISLTADDMAELKKAGGMVTKDSSTTSDHHHQVMFM